MKLAGILNRDLRLAADELGAGREMLRAAHEIAATSERRTAIAAACAKLALASRQIDDVVERCEAPAPRRVVARR